MTDQPSFTFDLGEAITPLDGRNYQKIKDLAPYFSESALNRYRLRVEIGYFKKLAEWKIIRKLTGKEIAFLEGLIDNYGISDHRLTKEFENQTNHDVKAVEYFIRSKFAKTSLEDVVSYVHFGLTSEDINNLSYSLIIKESQKEVLEKDLEQLVKQLKLLAKKFKGLPLLGRTHGQPAVGTTVGKELANYVNRLVKQLKKLESFRFEGKLNGAVGNHNALKAALPKQDWLKLSDEFIRSLGLLPNRYTTQILYYDNWLEYFQIVYLVNGILVDLAQNIWSYIMLNIFVQKKIESEVGSSTMPQKINPIRFEHAEGSLQLANSMLEFFQRKLLSSRLQRDLSDSTIRRNLGEALAYSLLGWRSLQAGIGKIFPNEKLLRDELNNHWEILAEAIQTVMRLNNDDEAYEKMKKLMRGKTIDKDSYIRLLRDLGLDDDKRLNNLTPEKYTGYAEKLVDNL